MLAIIVRAIDEEGAEGGRCGDSRFPKRNRLT